MRRLLVIGAGILQVPIIIKAQEMGHYVIAVDGNSNAPGLKLADKPIIENILSEELMLNVAYDEHIDGVIHPCSEVSMSVMGRINDELRLCGISKDTAIKATNKHLMRKAFEEYGVSSPKSIILKSVDHGWKLFNDTFLSNAILKPSRNSGSRGISKIEKGLSLLEFENKYNTALNESRDKSVLLEDFIDGPEFSVEIIAWQHMYHVLAVTDKKTTSAPYFVELGHNQPSLYSDEIVEVIKLEAIKGARALDIDNCAIHAELKIQGGIPYIIEIGARLGGDFISTELTHLSSGVDMVGAAINVALGIPPNLEPTKDKYGVCIRYICPKPGKVLSISNRECFNRPNVYSYDIYCKEGDIIREIRSSLDRSGHVIVINEDVDKAIIMAEEIVNEININTTNIY